MHKGIFERQRGMTLIEALIALLVLSIGLVGLGALMLTSLKNVHSSSHYSVASAIVLDFEERVWNELAATVSIDLLRLNENGCLSDDDIGTVAASTVADWETARLDGDGAWSGAQRYQLPGISIAIGAMSEVEATKSDGSSTGVYWKTIPLTVSWNEGRFADLEQESYFTTVTVVCRPTFL